MFLMNKKRIGVSPLNKIGPNAIGVGMGGGGGGNRFCNNKQAKIEQYRKVYLKGVYKENTGLEQIKKQKEIIATAQQHSKVEVEISKINEVENAIINSPMSVIVDELSFTLSDKVPNFNAINIVGPRSTDINTVPTTDNVQFKFSNETPTLAALLDNATVIKNDADIQPQDLRQIVKIDLLDIVDNGVDNGVDSETMILYQSLTGDEYELDDKIVVPAFLQFIRNNNIGVICNVYQEMYINKMATGFGDYIRGCYFLIQFCNYLFEIYKINIQFDFWISHQLSAFLMNGGELFSKFADNHKKCIPRRHDIVACDDQNWKGTKFNENGIYLDKVNSKKHILYFMNYLMYDGLISGSGSGSANSPKQSLFVYTISFPLYPKIITSASRDIIKYFFTPTNELSLYITSIMTSLSLMCGQYKIIHIRSGDNFLMETETGARTAFTYIYKQKIASLILKSGILDNNESKSVSVSAMSSVLIIADNNYIKDFIIGEFPFIKCIKKTIGHLGEGQIQEHEKIQNTLLDFYLLANSNRIVSFSSYKHGSGFSRWCAETYNIPYSCYFVKCRNV